MVYLVRSVLLYLLDSLYWVTREFWNVFQINTNLSPANKHTNHSDNVPLTRCHEPPVAPFNIITRSPVHGGSDTVNFTERRVIDYARLHLIHGITTTVNRTPCNDIERSNGRFVAPHKRDVIAVNTTLNLTRLYYVPCKRNVLLHVQSLHVANTHECQMLKYSKVR